MEEEFGSSDALIHPCLAVLAMGWSHSVFATQLIHEHLLDGIRGLEAAHRISRDNDLRVNRVRHAVYVDDLIIIGLNKSDVEKAQADYVAAAHERRLFIKPSKLVHATSEGVECLGFRIHGGDHTVGVHPTKLARLCADTRALIARRVCTGRQLASIVGKWTWAALACRPALSVFNSVYRYIRAADLIPFTLWRGVVVELNTMIGLAPLLFASISAPFFRDVVAVDASLVGEGVCALTVAQPLQSLLASHAGLRGTNTHMRTEPPEDEDDFVEAKYGHLAQPVTPTLRNSPPLISAAVPPSVRACAAAALSLRANYRLSPVAPARAHQCAGNACS